jgi:hypothetical protein
LAQCPNCNAQLDTDFGMVVCPSCASAIFFDLDGIPHIGNSSESEPELQPEVQSELQQEPDLMVPAEMGLDAFAMTTQDESGSQSAEAIQMGYSDNSDLDHNANSELELGQSAGQNSEFENIEVTSQGYGAEQSTDNPPAEEVIDFDQTLDQSMTQAPALSLEQELVDFGNSTEESELLYTLVIEGIDSKDTRSFVDEALTDTRLDLDRRALLGGIVNGKLTIEAISAVKASVIINRLKSARVNLKWRQSV